MKKTRKKPNIYRRSFNSLRRHLAIVHTPALLTVGTILAAILALTFAFTSHAIFMLDVIATLILKSFLIHRTHSRAKRKVRKAPTHYIAELKKAAITD